MTVARDLHRAIRIEGVSSPQPKGIGDVSNCAGMLSLKLGAQQPAAKRHGMSECLSALREPKKMLAKKMLAP